MANPFAWVEIPVDDMERARRFYEDVFEITLQRMPGTEFEMWAFDSDQTTYGASGALIRMPGYAAGKPGATVYFACMDCAVRLERAARRAASFTGRRRRSDHTASWHSSKTSKETRSVSTR
jgi:predicted enzyme related to lactoylglutathione lyase